MFITECEDLRSALIDVFVCKDLFELADHIKIRVNPINGVLYIAAFDDLASRTSGIYLLDRVTIG
jgi:hypothetical protein